MKAIAKLLPKKDIAETNKITFVYLPVFFDEKIMYATTKNVEIGDEVFFENGKYYGIIEDSYALPDKDDMYKPKLYKILGEISPNVTCVKDGDEIEVEARSKIMDKAIRQCEVYSEWEVNSSNGDALCHNQMLMHGIIGNRNTDRCKKCVYDEMTICKKVKEIICYKVKCENCNTYH